MPPPQQGVMTKSCSRKSERARPAADASVRARAWTLWRVGGGAIPLRPPPPKIFSLPLAPLNQFTPYRQPSFIISQSWEDRWEHRSIHTLQCAAVPLRRLGLAPCALNRHGSAARLRLDCGSPPSFCTARRLEQRLPSQRRRRMPDVGACLSCIGTDGGASDRASAAARGPGGRSSHRTASCPARPPPLSSAVP